MRKKFLCLCAVMAVLIFYITGCDLFSFTGTPNDQPSVQGTVSSPHIISFSNYLYWDSVNNATEYDIYKNGNYIETTFLTNYTFGELQQDTEFYVIAKNSSKNSVSQPSNSIVASKNINFLDSEILNLSDETDFNGTISSTIRKVIVHKSEQSDMEFEATIDFRTTDLLFEFKNAKLIGKIATKGDNYSRLKDDYNVIFAVSGDNQIIGKSGFAQTEVFEDNSEKDGLDGGDGLDAIIAPTIIVQGSGNLTIRGGNGGNGGNGASTTTYSTKTIGKGSNGGNGGSGVVTQYLIVNMGTHDSKVAVSGGLGGKKGNPGGNNSILTGPLVSMMWNDIYDIGKAGTSGKSVVGIVTILKGNLER
ncbi:MAG: hypothetical protein J1F36_04510 [Clostridiales bacterium]|nr:hypothetical protein [Clostridiales bacterium]